MPVRDAFAVSEHGGKLRGPARPQPLSIGRAGIISLDMETTGCGTAIVTPFRVDGAIDEAALWALVNWQIESGIDFLVACGSTGEAATLCGPRAGMGRLHAQLDTDTGAAGGLAAPYKWHKRGAFGKSLLQQALAGGAISALSGLGQDGGSIAGGTLQCAGTDGGQP